MSLLLIIYSQIKSVDELINKLLIFAQSSKKKSQDLRVQERKALTVLCNIMPKPVAKTMRNGQEEAPAYYASATICYIDIVGFMAIISRLKPVQVTKLFDKLYGWVLVLYIILYLNLIVSQIHLPLIFFLVLSTVIRFVSGVYLRVYIFGRMYDSLLELYKVHKVEQTNDVYCVIGGVPDKNSTHASDVANYVIQLMHNIKKFKMDEMSDIKIQIRCGMHTGYSLVLRWT